MYYLCSENKGADQLHGYHEADVRLCFCICRLSGFSRQLIYSVSERVSDLAYFAPTGLLGRKKMFIKTANTQFNYQNKAIKFLNKSLNNLSVGYKGASIC